ncbi:DUF5606 family protein [Mucilaginibacter ginsenosidivorans]|uniref:Uncharacterized protein n=1 Tax=Mucilaginibacter ginsenosidivorans TaxID=398053 RepID=A0A5B8V3C8_9SPHI|nr:DUF5606 domain-containing protein [Mucilaginibacter ginsenosidivorans]QEC65323.1 hypothetical protein FRZ54_23030 [Mucilaginibacter ginsenosidivorans]
MNLRGIVAVAGKPGLWKALAQNKTGFILESLDVQKIKLVVNLSTAKIAALDEITIFGDEEDIRLVDIFERMKTLKSVPDAKADGKVLRQLFREVAADHDEEKVYASDMKKIVSWYHIMKDMPLFSEEPPAEVAAEEPVKEEVVATAPAEEKKEPKKEKKGKKEGEEKKEEAKVVKTKK